MSERMDPIELRKVVDMKLRSDRFKFIEAARTEWQMDLDAAEDAIEKYEDLDALGEQVSLLRDAVRELASKIGAAKPRKGINLRRLFTWRLVLIREAGIHEAQRAGERGI